MENIKELDECIGDCMMCHHSIYDQDSLDTENCICALDEKVGD